MKRISIILMAFVLVVTMTQCKKNEETNQDKTVTITLDVKNNNGSKVDVNTITGTVNFETGDKVYVGSGGKYVGTLTHNGTNFVGNITNPTEGQPLQFYFLGNVTPSETLTAGTTEECSAIISDQTERLPVISCAPSFENYVSGVTAYTGHLLNKCALVKFNVTTPSNSPICVTGMKNKVTVDFTQNTITPNQDGEGVIKLPAGSGENVEKWAILLPQEALLEGLEGSVYSEDGSYTGIRPIVSNISENDYLVTGIAVTVNTAAVSGAPEGAINGLFTINEDGDQVYFSKGNLQYQASTNIWRFAENQWDYVGNTNVNISPTYGGWIDLFGWGTGDNPTNSSINNNNYNSFYDWGNNSISNGGNMAGQWRTLTGKKNGEWHYLFDLRNTTSGIRYAKATVNGVRGVILLPDEWNASYYSLYNVNTSSKNYSSNIINASDWVVLEQYGAVFLPAAGVREGNIQAYLFNEYGYYWSSTSYYQNDKAYVIYVESDQLNPQTGVSNRWMGYSVRLVQDY